MREFKREPPNDLPCTLLGRDGSQPFVTVQSTWSEWRTATVRLSDLQEVHWHQPPDAPRPILHAYVGCDLIVSGVIVHSCPESSAPHRLLVCILRAHALVNTFEELSRRAVSRLEK